MTLMTILIAIVIVAVMVMGFAIGKKQAPQETIEKTNANKNTPIKPSYLMSEHEKTMFNELIQSVPECYIFPQVAFGAILWTQSYASRNRYNRKIADFVVADRQFNILAIIELDDKSHDKKEIQDAERDAMLKEAGYKVLRYRHMPDKQKLRADILG